MFVLQVDIDFQKLYGIPGGKLRSELLRIHPAIVTEARSSKGIKGRAAFDESILNLYDCAHGKQFHLSSN